MTLLSSSGRGVSFGGFSGEHDSGERAQNDPKGLRGADFDPIPVSIVIDVIGCASIFV